MVEKSDTLSYDRPVPPDGAGKPSPTLADCPTTSVPSGRGLRRRRLPQHAMNATLTLASHQMFPEPPPRFSRTLRLLKMGSLVGFSGGMGLTAAQVAASVVPTPWQAITYPLAGATAALVAWCLLTCVFRRLDAATPRPRE